MRQYKPIKQITIAVLASSNFVFLNPAFEHWERTKTIRGFLTRKEIPGLQSCRCSVQ